MIYTDSYDEIPRWAYGIDMESLSDIENLERMDARYARDELDLLNDMDFLFEDFRG